MNTDTIETETIGTATYSLHDNKLRIYPDSRLSAEMLERVKGAGFHWAPHQELFVAPRWNPEREDFLFEVCGTISDETCSAEERAKDRAEAFQEYAQSRHTDSDQAHDAARSIMEMIPFGQPILVGHHSEMRARRDHERIDNSMRRAVLMSKRAEYWRGRAHAAIRHAEYKERPDVRARRIKGLESDARKSQRGIQEYEAKLKFWNTLTNNSDLEKTTGVFYTLPDIPWKDGDTAPDHKLPTLGDLYWRESYAFKNNWYVPRDFEAEIKPIGVAHLEHIIARQNRWLAHYNLRLEYERALLQAAGGIEADKTKPEIGGAVLCWCSPARGLCKVLKMNRKTVAVACPHGTTRPINVDFTELKRVLSAAEVQALRDKGDIQENEIWIFIKSEQPQKAA